MIVKVALGVWAIALHSGTSNKAHPVPKKHKRHYMSFIKRLGDGGFLGMALLEAVFFLVFDSGNRDVAVG